MRFCCTLNTTRLTVAGVAAGSGADKLLVEMLRQLRDTKKPCVNCVATIQQLQDDALTREQLRQVYKSHVSACRQEEQHTPLH